MNVVNRLLLNKFLLLTVKIVSLFAFIGLIAVGFQASSSDAVLLKQLRNTNLSNLFVWSYWWPMIIVAAIVFGRVWCMVCPVELLTSTASKVGAKFKRPKWLLSGWGITLFYLLILVVGINIFAIHRNPSYMAIYLLSIIGISIITGLLYEKNTFCRYLCPVGNLLGLYSKLSLWGWRVKDQQTCASCKDKSCIDQKHRYSVVAKSCGVDLYPANIKDNAYCILCANCLNSCDQYNSKSNPKRPNPGFVKVGLADGLLHGRPLLWAEWFFLFMISGFVIYEILSEYYSAKSVLLFTPRYIITFFQIQSAVWASLIKSFFLFLLLPGIIWLTPYGVICLVGNKLTIKNYLTYFGLTFIPIVAGAHFCKALLKMVSRIPYFEFLLGDIVGIETAHAIVSKKIILQKLPEWSTWILSITVLVIMLFCYFLSLKVVKSVVERLDLNENKLLLQMITFIYFMIFFVDLILWRSGIHFG